MNRNNKLLLGLEVFNAASAIGGGIALMAGVIDQAAWTRHTGFTTPYFTGVILMAVVGGSALIAALALAKKITGWQLANIVAGAIMLVWIVGEIVSIRGLHILQLLYIITGLAVLWLTPKE